jgi:hypothetical protein
MKIRTLVLLANGFGWRPVLADTIIQGLLHFRSIDDLPSPLRKIRLFQRALKSHYEAVSYMVDWRDALCQSSKLDVTLCNINDVVTYYGILKYIKEYELIIILHSACGDDLSILKRSVNSINKRIGKLVIFVGNEYDLMSDKIAFINSTEPDFICSQLPIEGAKSVYSDCKLTEVLEMPHALNPAIYSPPTLPNRHRSIDIGFRGAQHPLFIGDIERHKVLRYLQKICSSLELRCDIRYKILHRLEWRDYLSNCNSIVGAESGSYYLERTGAVINSAKKFTIAHPEINFDKVYSLFFEGLPKNEYTKCISSRHFEPIGTKTCQLLVEGKYNNILQSDIHYIRIKKDLSNIDDVIARLKDEHYRTQMVEKTYEYVMDAHTYHHRVEKLINTIV